MKQKLLTGLDVFFAVTSVKTDITEENGGLGVTKKELNQLYYLNREIINKTEENKTQRQP